MSVRILILANDPQYSRWLQHRIETFGGAFTALLRDLASVQSGARNLTRLDCDLLIAVLDFRVNEDESSAGLLWLRDTVRSTDAPPLLVIAENGDELSAVQALRLGATDYLPRTLLTADRLVSCLHRCLVPTIAPLGNNVFRNADYDFNRMEDTYSIINNDNGVGEHWLSVYQEHHSVYIFDTFGRDMKILMPEFHARARAQGYSIINANKKYEHEQEANQSDCGLRSLAWLILAESKGIKTATII